MRSVRDPSRFEESLSLRFNDKALLLEALTHSSYAAENPPFRSNERMEFLGDSVLEFIITEAIYAENPAMNEGEMAKFRSTIVSSTSLAKAARSIDLGEHLLLGKGAENSGLKDSDSILENAFEALIAALYLDLGLAKTKDFVLELFKSSLNANYEALQSLDFKTELQEFAMKHFKELPNYRLVEESGPFHDLDFIVEVSLAKEVTAHGKGKSKKGAEQEAAKSALDKLKTKGI